MASFHEAHAVATQTEPEIDIGAGIVTPNPLTAFSTNAAGFSRIHGLRLVVGARNTAQDTLDPIRIETAAYYGNGVIGGGISRLDILDGGSQDNGFVGLGMNIKPLNLSVGVACDMNLSAPTDGGCKNQGLIWNR